MGRVMTLRGLQQQQEAGRLSLEANKLKLRDAELQSDAALRDAADDAAVRAAISTHQGDWSQILPALARTAPGAYTKAFGFVQKQREDQAKAFEAQMKATEQQLDLMGRVAGGITDEASFHAARSISPQIGAVLGEQYDPARIEQLVAQGMTVKDSVTALGEAAVKAQQALKGAADAEDAWRQSVTTAASTATNDQQYQQIVGRYRAMVPGNPALARVLEAMPQIWSPENMDRVRQLGMTVPQRVTAEATERTADRADIGLDLQRARVGISEGQLRIAQQREARSAREGAGGTSAAATRKAAAERWKANALAALEKEGLPDVDEMSAWRTLPPQVQAQYPTPTGRLSDDQMNARKLLIENGYRAQIGMEPLATLPASWQAGRTAEPVRAEATPTPGGRTAPGAVEAAPAKPPTPGKIVTEAQLRALAHKLGTSINVQRQRAQANGYTIVR
jgi:hypothetical protein